MNQEYVATNVVRSTPEVKHAFTMTMQESTIAIAS